MKPAEPASSKGWCRYDLRVEIHGASGDAGCARLLAGAVPAVDCSTLDGLVDLGDQSTVLGFHGIGITLSDRRFKAMEVSLDCAGEASVLDTFMLGANDSFFL